MNKQRREVVARMLEKLAVIQDDLSVIADGEREAYENLPDSLQEGERGQKMSDAADLLEEALGSLEVTVEALQEAQE